MKKIVLITVHFLTAAALVAVACTEHPINQLKGNWVAMDGQHVLKITDKTFAFDIDEKLTRDYFVKGDTIFTTFDDNQSRNLYVIKHIDKQNLTLLNSDSAPLHFQRK